MAKISGTLDYAGLEQLTTAARTAIAAGDLFVGRIVYDTDLNKAFYYNGTSWQELADDADLDTHIADTSTHGIASAIVGTDEAQTLINKTIDADNNTISNLAHGAEVDDPNTGVHGVGAGEVVGTDLTQTLTNKTIDGDDNTIQDVSITSLKTELADADKFIERDATGAVISGKSVPVGDVVGSSDAQTLTNKTIDADNNTISNLAHGAEVDDPDTGVHGVGAGEVVGTDKTQTLTNKTIDGDDNTIQDVSIASLKTELADADKFIERDATGAVISGKSVPVGDVVGSSDAQTLTNKTIDADNNTISNLAHGFEVDNPTSDIHGATGALFGLGDNPSFTSTGHIKVPAGTTAERDGSPVNGMLRYNSDEEEFEGYADGAWGSLGGGGLVPTKVTAGPVAAESGVHYLTDSTPGPFTINLPGTPAAGDSVRVSDSYDKWDVNNVTVSGNGNNINGSPTLVLDVKGQWVQFMWDDVVGQWVTDDPIDGGIPAATGGGAGFDVNYLEDNWNAEDEVTTGYVTYADAAGVAPVDGVGGTANITFATTTAVGEVLRGLASYKISKDAADRQGEGVSYDFTLDEADFNKILKVEFDFKTSANYSSGDIKVYLVRDTGGTPTVVNLSQPDLPQGQGRYEATFVTTGDDDWRLCFHVASTNASAYDVFLDHIKVNQETAIPGVPVTDWISFTPSIQGYTSPAIAHAKWRRIGDSMEISCRWSAGAPDGSNIKLLIPNGLTSAKADTVGTFNKSYTGTSPGAMRAIIDASDLNNIGVSKNDGADGFSYISANSISTGSSTQEINAVVEIAEWSGSGVDMSAARVEYVYNSGTWASDNTTSFAYGPNGAAITGNAGGYFRQRVRFQTPVQPTDVITLEIQLNNDPIWMPMIGATYTATSLAIQPFNYYGAPGSLTSIGVGFDPVAGSDTDIDVRFGRFYGSTLDTGTTPGWSNFSGVNARWRVRKSSPNAPAGIQLATATTPGLLPPPSQMTDEVSSMLGHKVYEHGVSYNGGQSPVITLSFGGGSLSSVTASSFIPYQMQDGGWRMRFNFAVVVSATTRTNIGIAVSGVTSKNNGAYQTFSGVLLSGSGQIYQAYIAPNSGVFAISHPSVAGDVYGYAGDIDLESKPTWAY